MIYQNRGLNLWLQLTVQRVLYPKWYHQDANVGDLAHGFRGKFERFLEEVEGRKSCSAGQGTKCTKQRLLKNRKICE